MHGAGCSSVHKWSNSFETGREMGHSDPSNIHPRLFKQMLIYENVQIYKCIFLFSGKIKINSKKVNMLAFILFHQWLDPFWYPQQNIEFFNDGFLRYSRLNSTYISVGCDQLLGWDDHINTFADNSKTRHIYCLLSLTILHLGLNRLHSLWSGCTMT